MGDPFEEAMNIPPQEEEEPPVYVEDPEPDGPDVKGHRNGKGYIVGENGKIICRSKFNIKLALKKAGIKLRFDQLRHQILANDAYLDDHLANKLYLELPFAPARQFAYDVFDWIAQKNAFHPILDYLRVLKWDGRPRLDTWLTDWLGAEDTEFNRAVGAITLIAAVRRLRQTGGQIR